MRISKPSKEVLSERMLRVYLATPLTNNALLRRNDVKVILWNMNNRLHNITSFLVSYQRNITKVSFLIL